MMRNKDAERIAAELTNWAERQSVQAADRDELVQETMLRLLRALSKRGIANPAGYAMRIARNLLADRMRSKAKRREVRLHDSHAAAPRAERPDIDELRDVAATMPNPDRLLRAARLHYEEGLTQREVAHELGTTRDAIKAMLYRLRTRAKTLRASSGALFLGTIRVYRLHPVYASGRWFTRREFADLNGIPERTAQRWLRSFVRRGVIEREGHARAVRYRATR